VLFGTSFFSLHSNFGIYRIVPEFLLGIALYRWGSEHRLRWLQLRAAVPLLAAAILMVSAFDATLLSLLMLAVLILAAAESARSGHGGPLTWASLTFLGEASYSLYMIHVPVATVLFQGAKIITGTVSVGFVVVALLVAVGLSAVCFLLLERPCQKLVLRLVLGRASPRELGPAPRVEAEGEQTPRG
jgi:peptidoglycan/LPS O-acetylase OafA/YrhL